MGSCIDTSTSNLDLSDNEIDSIYRNAQKTLDSFQKIRTKKNNNTRLDYKKVYEDLARIEKDSLIAESYRERAIWHRNRGQQDLAITLSNVAKYYFVKLNMLPEASRQLNNSGLIYESKGDYVTAIKFYQEAQDVSRTAKDSSGLGWALNNISTPFRLLKDLTVAENYLKESLQIAKQTNNNELYACANINLGNLYSDRNLLKKALTYYDIGESYAQEFGFRNFELLAIVNKTDVFNKQKEYDKSIDLLEKTLQNVNGLKDKRTALLHLNMFEALLGKKSFDPALEYLHKMCAISEEINYFRGIDYCKSSMSDFYETIGDHEKALFHFKEHKNLQDKHFGAEAHRKIRELITEQTAKYQEREIKELKKAESLTRERRRNYFILASLFIILIGTSVFLYLRGNMRAKLAENQKKIAESKLQALQSQMNPHFIFNAMNGIQNYILKSKKMEAYKYLGKFASLLRNITKASATTSIPLEEEIHLINTYLELEKLRFRDELEYKVKVVPNLLQTNPEIPSMMIQPVIENAIIHGLSGKKEQGNLKIHFKPHLDGLVCEIIDNGIGRIAAQQIAKKQNQKHLSIASENGKERLQFLRNIGYDNARIIIEDLYDAEKAIGTKVSLFLPFLIEDIS